MPPLISPISRISNHQYTYIVGCAPAVVAGATLEMLASLRRHSGIRRSRTPVGPIGGRPSRCGHGTSSVLSWKPIKTKGVGSATIDARIRTDLPNPVVLSLETPRLRERSQIGGDCATGVSDTRNGIRDQVGSVGCAVYAGSC